jgi:hypothetical protein
MDKRKQINRKNRDIKSNPIMMRSIRVIKSKFNKNSKNLKAKRSKL